MDKNPPLMSDAIYRRLVALRRRIHRYPEPSFEEHRTAAAIMKYLDRLGIPYRSGIARTGIVARLDCGVPGTPTVALRADIDALPIPEKTGLPFASKHKNCMHACGHDGHIAIVLGAAELMKKHPPKNGNVVFLFQPAEEGGAGAQKMVEEGALDGVDMIFGGHIEGRFELGQIAMRTSIDSSFTDELRIRITGRGGHAARPQETVDAIVVASLFVLALQNIISRAVDPLTPTVLSICSMHAGSVYNAIADEAELKGTVRNTDAATRTLVLERIRKTAEALATLHGARIEVEVVDGYPPVINHPLGYELARTAAEEFFGRENFVHLPKPSMGGEDFAYYLHKIPGAFVRIGSGPHTTSGTNPPLLAHSSHYDFDEEVIRYGGAFYNYLARSALNHMNEKGSAWAQT